MSAYYLNAHILFVFLQFYHIVSALSNPLSFYFLGTSADELAEIANLSTVYISYQLKMNPVKIPLQKVSQIYFLRIRRILRLCQTNSAEPSAFILSILSKEHPALKLSFMQSLFYLIPNSSSAPSATLYMNTHSKYLLLPDTLSCKQIQYDI